MPDTLPTILFWLCAVAIVIAQVRILRSTRRAWALNKDGKGRVGFAEWSFAVGLVVILGVLLWATYRAVNGVGA